jgi:flavin reductase (DIM6/NTAB) family NADH-FMN oxidoreductase RutF
MALAEEERGQEPQTRVTSSQQAEVMGPPLTTDVISLESSVFNSSTSGQSECTSLSSDDSCFPPTGTCGDFAKLQEDDRSAALDPTAEIQKSWGPDDKHEIAHGSSPPIPLSNSPDHAHSTSENDPLHIQENDKRALQLQLSGSAQQAPNMVPAPSTSHGEESPSSFTKRRMRQIMRRVPQAVAIVTATDIRDPQNPWRGVTVSSFTTVTFEPEVIVSFNLKLPSATFEAIQCSGRFDVNMLKSNHKGAEVASQFARGHAASPFGNAQSEASLYASRRATTMPLFAPPRLAQESGRGGLVSFRIQCTYMTEKTVQLGDHVVIFATVKGVPEWSRNHLVRQENKCLAYIDGRYGQVKPLSKRPQGESMNLTVQKNSNILPTTGRITSPSRRGLLAFESRALESLECFKKAFLSEVFLEDLGPETVLLVRKLRYRSRLVLEAILQFSRTVSLSTTSSSNPSPLSIGISQLTASYFIFCASSFTARRMFPHLPQSIADRLRNFHGHVYEIESSITSIQRQVGYAVIPDPHPILALRKVPFSIGLALPYLHRYAEYFIADMIGVYEECMHLSRETSNLFFRFVTRMKLLRIWLRRGSDSLTDALLDVPARYLLPIRDWLVLSAKVIWVEYHFMSELSQVPHKGLRKSLKRYFYFNRSLWRDFVQMEPFRQSKTLAGMMKEWKATEAADRRLRQYGHLTVKSRGLNIKLRKRIMRQAIESDDPIGEEYTKNKVIGGEDDAVEIRQDVAKGHDADHRSVQRDGTDNESDNISPPIAHGKSDWTGDGLSKLSFVGQTKHSRVPLTFSKGTLGRVMEHGLVETDSTHELHKSNLQASSRYESITLRLVSGSNPTERSRLISKIRLQKFHSMRETVEAVNGTIDLVQQPRSMDVDSGSSQRRRRGRLQRVLPTRKTTDSTKYMASIPLRTPADPSAVDENITADQPGNSDMENLGTGRSAKSGPKVANIRSLIRFSPVDNPLFRKTLAGPDNVWKVSPGMKRIQPEEISNSESDNAKTPSDNNPIRRHYAHPKVPIRRHYPRSNQPIVLAAHPNKAKFNNPLESAESVDIEALIQRVLIRKHQAHGKQPASKSIALNQPEMNNNLKPEQNADIEALIKALTYGSGARIKKHFHTSKSDKQAGLLPYSRVSDLRADIKKVIMEFSGIRYLDVNKRPGMPSPMTVARKDAMKKDIDDVMGEIDEFFRPRSNGKGDQVSGTEERSKGAHTGIGVQMITWETLAETLF